MNRKPLRRQQRSFSLTALQRVSSGLSSAGLLLLGAGLGMIGYGFISAQTAPADPSREVFVAASPLPIGSQPIQPSPQPQQARPKSSAPAPQITTRTTDVRSATVCVKTTMPSGEDFCASGVAIDPALAGIDPQRGSVVITNYHVVYDTNRPKLQLGGKGEVMQAEIIRQSPEYDLALLLVPGIQFAVAPLAEASPGQGTQVRAIGFPNNQPLTVNDSRLLGQTQECLAVAPCLALQQGTITFGNSGGPLEANGQVVGITQGEIRDEIAIPVEQVRQFLAGNLPTTNRRSSDRRANPSYPSYPDYPPDYYPPSRSYPSYPRMRRPSYEPPWAMPPDYYPPPY
jgi:S1-C subfamily serine protease